LQDAFLQVFRSIGRFRGDSSLSTWLHRIAWNAALLKIRSAKRRPEVSLEECLPRYDETGHRIEPFARLRRGPDEELENKETLGHVRACVERLPALYRAVIYLRDFEEKSTKEAAEILGTNETVVKVRLHRARKALATLLSGALGLSAPTRDPSLS
jgi:RNA polymerase sigma-70 factor (ECF subfamily)